MSTALKDIRPYVGMNFCDHDQFLELTPKATGGSSTNIRVDSLKGAYDDDKFNDFWGRFVASTDAGTGFRVTDFTTADGDLTISPSVGDAPVAADLVQIAYGVTFTELDKAINYAILSIEDDALEQKTDTSISLHNMFSNPNFEIYATGTFTGWTQDSNSTFTQESSIVREGAYSCKMVTDGTNEGYISKNKTNFQKYIGKSVQVKVRVATTTADRVFVRITDGVNTTDSGYHSGAGWLDGSGGAHLQVNSFTLAATATELTASIRVSAGTAVTVYIDYAIFPDPFSIFEYSVPSGFEYIREIIQESSEPDRFNYDSGRVNPEKGWRIVSDGTTPKIVFDPQFCNLTAGRKILLQGQSKPSVLTSESSTTEIYVPYLVQKALEYLCEQRATDPRYQAKLALARDGVRREFPKAQSRARGKRVHW